ncbi:hypothetical protein [Streptomyces sp. H39-S7]|uniref:hypothetical protein n=1 Tax=Streptomyces sp. H39-S7 TaxID=3004357 RepID=UPI0022AF33D8|nr:hypothetical protein [Streptomyces sp. H39-S7]MCZ4122923.1 hypothetical protein [Streptomyces sp. H39-S7]
MTTSQAPPMRRESATEVPRVAPVGIPAVPPTPPPRRRRSPALRVRLPLHGPARLVVSAALALAALAALCATAVLGAVDVRGEVSALDTAVSQRAAVAAELRFALADLDAQRANSLVPGHSALHPDVEVGNRLLALITAQQRRAEVSGLLRQLGADPAQGDRVRSLLDALGRFDDAGARSSYVDETHPDRPAGIPPHAAVALSSEAADVLRNELLPVAAALSETYAQQAAHRESAAWESASWSAALVGVSGVLALGFLLWWQRDLSRRYHRRLNPALVAATAAALVVTVTGALSFASAASEVDAAGREGLRPWSRLAEARAVAADAAATQSRWLVHDADSAGFQSERFTTLTRRLDVLLAPEPSVATAERPAYQDVSTRYGHFRADDRKLRELRAAGRLEEAVTVLTEVGRGQVAFDFWDFATTLDALADHQRSDFDLHTARARSALAGWPAVPAGALAAAAVLVLLGIRPRLAEYR